MPDLFAPLLFHLFLSLPAVTCHARATVNPLHKVPPVSELTSINLFKVKDDLMLALTKWFLCLNLTTP